MPPNVNTQIYFRNTSKTDKYIKIEGLLTYEPFEICIPSYVNELITERVTGDGKSNGDFFLYMKNHIKNDKINLKSEYYTPLLEELRKVFKVSEVVRTEKKTKTTSKKADA